MKNLYPLFLILFLAIGATSVQAQMDGCKYCESISITFVACDRKSGDLTLPFTKFDKNGYPIFEGTFDDKTLDPELLKCLCPKGGSITFSVVFDTGGAWAVYQTCEGEEPITIAKAPGSKSDCNPFSGKYEIASPYTEVIVNSDCKALPVRLSYFTVGSESNNAVLKWTTEQEINNKSFVVERSRDAKNFVAIGSLDGRGNKQNTEQYTFTDTEPLVGLSYYRLNQIDFDGSHSYSNIKSFINDVGLVIFPNPSSNVLNITMPIGLKGTAKIYNQLGKLEKQLLLNDTTQLVKLESLPAGIYFVEISDEFGNKIKTQKIVKQ